MTFTDTDLHFFAVLGLFQGFFIFFFFFFFFFPSYSWGPSRLQELELCGSIRRSRLFFF